MSSANFGRWGALAAMLGGALWALFPFGTPIANIEEPGTLAYPTSVAYYWLMAVAPLLLVGLVGLFVTTGRGSGAGHHPGAGGGFGIPRKPTGGLSSHSNQQLIYFPHGQRTHNRGRRDYGIAE